MPLAPTVPLPHGATMPQLGVGTWPMSSAEAERAVPTAIEAGYRLVGTAHAHGHEGGGGGGPRAARPPPRGGVGTAEAKPGGGRAGGGPRAAPPRPPPPRGAGA